MSTPGEREQYRVGFQHGLRAAITWLHGRAKTMDDPHAELVLDSAATNLGWDAQKMTKRRTVIIAETAPNIVRK
jgi:hypothetical protein